jgi:hypothetical protein
MADDSRLLVLDPTEKPVPAQSVVAPRPETLDGAVLGLLANGKRNADVMLSMVHEILADRFQFKDVVARDKDNASRPCPRNLMDEMARLCDVVVTASGD